MKNIKYIITSLFLLCVLAANSQITITPIDGVTAEVSWTEDMGTPNFYQYKITVENFDIGYFDEIFTTEFDPSETSTTVMVVDPGLYTITVNAMDDMGNSLYLVGDGVHEFTGGGGGGLFETIVISPQVAVNWEPAFSDLDFAYYQVYFMNTETFEEFTYTINDVAEATYLKEFTEPGYYTVTVSAFDIYDVEYKEIGTGSFSIFDPIQFNQTSNYDVEVQWTITEISPDFNQYRLTVENTDAGYSELFYSSAGDPSEVAMLIPLPTAQIYSFYLESIDAFGETISVASDETFTPIVMGTFTVSATPTNMDVAVSWDEISTPDFDKYTVFFTNTTTSNETSFDVGVGNSATTTYNGTMTETGDYNVVVKSFDASGNEIAATNTASFTASDVPQTVTSSVSDNSVTLNWEEYAGAGNFLKYKIVNKNNDTGEEVVTYSDLSVTSTSTQLTINKNGSYTAAIYAMDANAQELQTMGTTNYTVNSPNNFAVTCTVTDNTLNINWTALPANERFNSYKLTVTNTSNQTETTNYVSVNDRTNTTTTYNAIVDGKYTVKIEAVDYAKVLLQNIGTADATVNYYVNNVGNNTANIQQLNVTGTEVNLDWSSAITSATDFSHFKITFTNKSSLKTSTLTTVSGDINHTALVFNTMEYGEHTLIVEAVSTSGAVLESTASTTFTTEDIYPPLAPEFAPYTVSSNPYKLCLEWSDLSETGDFAGYKFFYGLVDGTLTPVTLTDNTYCIDVAVDNEYRVEVQAYDPNNNFSEKAIEQITIYPYETEENFNIDNADLVNTKIYGNLQSGDEDFFYKTLTADRRYYFKIETTVYNESHIENVHIALYKADGTLVEQAFADAENPYPELFIDVEEDGNYYLKVYQTDRLITGGYGLATRMLESDEYEVNNTIAEAKELPLEKKDLTLYPTHDNDYYKISLTANQYLKLWFTCEIDATAYIADANGNVLHSVKIQANRPEQLVEYPVYRDGEYYVLFNAGAKLQVGSYTMRAEVISQSDLVGKLVINEIYHNANYGFIEIYNNSSETISLENIMLQTHKEFQFPEGAQIAAGEYQVITHTADFSSFFGVEPTYLWEDNPLMFNYDFEVILKDETEKHIDIVPYGIETGWYQYKNNGDLSLELLVPFIDNADQYNWHLSYAAQGTPLIINSKESNYTADYYEPNNSAEEFKQLYENTYELTLSSFKSSNYADIEDWFAVKGEAGNQLNLDVTIINNLNLKIEVFDENLTAIYTYELQSGAQNIQHTFAADGHIFIRTEALNSEGYYQIAVASTYPAKNNTWTESFENLTEGFMPAYWATFSNDDDKNTWGVANEAGTDFSKAIRHIPNSYFSNDWLITPIVTLGQRDYLQFDYKNEYVENGATAYIQVLIGDADAKNIDDFTVLVKELTLTNTELQTISVDLLDYANQTKRLALNVRTSQSFFKFIDNVQVVKAPPMGNLNGTVTLAGGTTPIVGAMVEVAGYSTTTDAAGAFSFTDLPAGVHNVFVSKTGHENAMYIFEIEEFQTKQLSAKLRAYTSTEIYSSENDNGTAGEGGADISHGFDANNKIYKSKTGATFIVIDRTKKQSRTEVFSWSTSQAYAINLNDIISPKLSFYYQLEDPAVRVTLKIKSLVANIETTLDFDNNLTTNWNKLVYDLSDLSDNPAYSSCIVEFVVERDVALTKGFSLLIDEVKVYGIEQQKSPVPDIIETYPDNSNHALYWGAVGIANVSYKVYRKDDEFSDYVYLGTTNSTAYTDATSNVNSEYFYSVVATYDWGDSDFADMALAVPNKNTVIEIAYSETDNKYYETNFDTQAESELWTRSMLNSNNNFWQYQAEDGLWAATGSERKITQTAEILLSSPVFDVSNRQHSVIAEFKIIASGLYTGLTIYCVYLDENGQMQLKTLGTLSQSNEMRYRVDITKHVDKSSYVQLLFGISGNNYQFENQYSYTFDEFKIEDIPSGYFTVDVKSTTGVPIKQATVYIPQHDRYYTTNDNGTVTSSLGDFFDGDEINIAVATAESLNTYVSDLITIEANKTFALSVTLDMQLPVMPQPEIAYNAAESNIEITWDDAMSLSSIGQEVFTGKYNLYKVVNGSTLQLIAGNITGTSYTDNTNILNDKGYYKVAALYDLGEGGLSQPAEFEINSLAQIDASLSQSYLSIPYSTDNSTVNVSISNTGKSPLHYNLYYNPAVEINMDDIEIDPQYHGLEQCVIMPLDEFPTSGEADIRFALLNLNNDSEWLKRVSITFPNGIEVLSSTNFVEPESERFLLSNLITGNGVTITWNNPDGLNAPGKIYDGKVAYATIRVNVSPDYYEAPSFTYTLWGDSETGEWEHQIEKSFTEHDLPIDVDFTPELVTEHHVLDAGASTQHEVNITVNQHTNELLPGYVTIESNSLGNSEVNLPLNINLEPNIVPIKVQFLNEVTHSPVKYSEVTIYGKTLDTDEDGFVEVNVPDAQNISVFADIIDYKAIDTYINSNDQFPVVLLTPDLPKAEVQSTDVQEKSITIDWTITQDALSAAKLQKIIVKTTDDNDNSQEFELDASAVSFSNDDIVPGNYYIEIVAVYNLGTATSSLGLVTINNEAPVFEAIANQTIDEDRTLELPVTVTDANNQQVELTVSTNNENVVATLENGQLTLTPYANWSGTCVVTLLANDGISLSDMAFELTVSEINDLPELQNMPAKDFYTGGVYNFVIDAVDVESEDVAIAVNGLPTWLTYDAATKTISGTVPETANGESNYTINLDDNNGGVVDVTIELNVIQENLAPTLVSDAKIVATQNDVVNYQLIVEDANNDNITVTVTEIPSWLTFDSNNMLITGTASSIGFDKITIQLSDGTNTADVEIQVQVSSDGSSTGNETNTAPVIQPFNQGQIVVGKPYKLAISAYDADDDVIVFTPNVLPEGLTLEQTANTYCSISGTITDATQENLFVSITATDGNSVPIEINFFLQVVLSDIQQDNVDMKAKFYPTITENVLFVDFPQQSDNEWNISIFNLNGKLMYNRKAMQTEIENGGIRYNLASGSYFIRLNSGKETNTGFFIVK